MTKVYVGYIHEHVAGFPDALTHCTGFDWDAGNAEKNWQAHRVSAAEAEQVFYNRPVLITEDPGHSVTEPRFAALGKTDADRTLHVVFTVRGPLVRVISARDASRKERRAYAQAQEKPAEA